MRSLKAKLRHQRHDDDEPIVVVSFDGSEMSAEEARTAAIESGNIPTNAAIFVFPKRMTHEEWAAHVASKKQDSDKQPSPGPKPA